MIDLLNDFVYKHSVGIINVTHFQKKQLACVTFSQSEAVNICLLALKVITVQVLLHIQNKFIQSPY